ncbi:MAG: hypothetical protein EOO91_07795 [Pedobacter sp.]|nr:MAG: hypothetical protein EOO91_07795 [Pedobacter sp.]
MDRIDHLKIVYNSYLSSEKDIKAKIFSEENGRFHFIPAFEGYATIYAIYSIYLLKDFEMAKCYFYRASRVAEYMSLNYDWRIIESGIDRLSYALLSDDTQLIKKYSVLSNKQNNQLSIGFQIANAVQNIILDNMQKLDENIKNLERFVKLTQFKSWEPIVDIFKGFLNSKVNLIELGLQTLLNTDKKRNKNVLINKFFSPDTSGLCKLAWLKGYQIDLKSSLVPMELMPIKPLAIYEDYDFFKEL